MSASFYFSCCCYLKPARNQWALIHRGDAEEQRGMALISDETQLNILCQPPPLLYELLMKIDQKSYVCLAQRMFILIRDELIV